jgi:predicted outer membrane repeat protein
MHLKFPQAAARAAVFGGIVTLGLGTTQAALATTPTYVNVPCSTSALITNMTNPHNDTFLTLANNCTYTLTSPYMETGAGLPAVTNELTIIGHANTWIKRSTAEGTDGFTIFAVNGVPSNAGDLTLDDVNLANGGGTGAEDLGVTSGGAINNDEGTVTINNGTFSDNSARCMGGAIFNEGTDLSVNDATFTDNSSEYGGAIYTEDGDPTVTGGTFSDNTASDFGGAIDNEGTLTLKGANFSDNSAEDGGAVYNDDSATITGGLYSQNSASEDGGAVYSDDTLAVSELMISKNTAEYGGGVYNYGATHTATIDTSQISKNHATDGGGGIYNEMGTVNLDGTLVQNNTPDNCEPLGTITGCAG